MGHYRKDCISFLMTTNCNLACEYCYLRDCHGRRESIDIEFAKRGLLDYFAHSSSRHIRFFAAGEPTLEMQKIQAIYRFAEEIAGEALKSEIQTNGVFPSQVATWLAHKIDIIWLSWDGPPDIHDSARRTREGHATSPTIERNCQILLEQGSDLLLGARATITNANLYRQIEMLDYFSFHGISAVFSDPVFSAVQDGGEETEKPNLDEGFMITYAEEYLKARQHADKIGVFYGTILAVNFDEESELSCRSCLPSPHLTPDGYVTCCDMASGGDVFPDLAYGKYDPLQGIIVYDERKLAQIRLRRARNLLECQGCSVLLHCAGACFGEGVNETGRLLGVKKDYCEAIQFLAKHLPINAGLYPYLHP